MKIKDNGNGTFSFFCPGCGIDHVFYVNVKHHNGSQWSFNGNKSNPIFEPSLLNTWGKLADPNWVEPEEDGPENGWSGKCHLFITNGVINYCGDCTHSYNGKQGIPMKEY